MGSSLQAGRDLSGGRSEAGARRKVYPENGFLDRRTGLTGYTGRLLDVGGNTKHEVLLQLQATHSLTRSLPATTLAAWVPFGLTFGWLCLAAAPRLGCG